MKINHGTVPVGEDGSAHFKAPSNAELYFQALDAGGKEIIRMGSVTQITTGEFASCVGCHENRFSPPPVGINNMARLKRPPDRIEPPSWGAGPVDYVRQVQPVLDKYCVKCHSGATPRKDIDLSGDKTRFYSMSYESLVFRRYVDYFYLHDAPSGNFPALSTGSWVSKLTKLIESKHSKVNMDEQSRRCIYAWIDANVPYYGTWDMTRPWTQGGRDAYAKTVPPARKSTVPGRVIRGRPVAQPWVAKYNALLGRLRLPNRGPNPVNLTHPEWSRILIRNLAKSAGGTADDKKARFKSKNDPGYRELLGVLTEAGKALLATPRIDMPGARPLPQERDFGRTF